MVRREEVAPDNAHQFQEMTEVVRRQGQARLAQLGRDSNFFPLFAGFPIFLSTLLCKWVQAERESFTLRPFLLG